ncbi:MAG: glycoside hydrolase family 95 protein [Spirochaetales bacterium]|nr:glycoside hydrolase family 95 protein [Spirochaetales bacterium]
MYNNSFEFHKPAAFWGETILLGNGSTGLSLWGGVGNERIQLNHDTFWAGSPKSEDAEMNSSTLELIRQKITGERFLEAEKLLENKLSGLYTSPYQPMGELYFNYNLSEHSTETKSYRRSLNLSDATYSQSFDMDKGSYLTEGFVSYPSSIAVLKFSTKGSVEYNGVLSYLPPYSDNISRGNTLNGADYIVYSIKAPVRLDGFMDAAEPEFSDVEGINGFITVRIVPSDGYCTIKDDSFHIKESTEFTVLIHVNTDWDDRGSTKSGIESLDAVMGRNYLELKEEHFSDYTALYSQIELSLESESRDKPSLLPDRLIGFEQNTDPGLIELLFNYGRYLLISSSRPGNLPANLQGIWNSKINPPWWSNYTLNINTEMNYWGSCLAGLSSCAQPLYDFAMRLMKNGQRTANLTYGCNGWCSHHQTDLWAATTVRGRTDSGVLEGNVEYSLWPFSGVWLSFMAWEHYEYTGDKEFLRDRVRPLLEGSVRFLKDFLIEDSAGMLTTSPSTSPENRFKWKDKFPAVSSGSTMDLSLTLETIQSFLAMSSEISCNESLVDWCRVAVGRIKPFRIGRLSQLQEWSGDWDREEDKHRHVSHLFSLYPGNYMTKPGMEEYRTAAGKSLEMRGMDATGWSNVWKIALMARLGKSEKISKLFKKLLKMAEPGDEKVHFFGSGSYPNLLCAHPPFQIDGNLGIIAAISEILIHQIDNSIILLPALPKEWENGYFHNVQCKYGLKVSLEWGQGKLKYVKIISSKSGKWKLIYRDNQQVVDLVEGGEMLLDGELNQEMK